MSDAKTGQRIRRFLQLLAKAPATLRETGDPAVKLLEFAGERSLRCRAADIDAMARAGSITIEACGDCARICLTDAGRAASRREKPGDFTDQHRRVRETAIMIDGRSETVAVNDMESPLAVLGRMRRPDGRPWLDRAELAAGERLRADFEQALLQPRVTASWDLSRVARSGGTSAGGATDLADRVLAARDRVNAAIDAVGPDLGGALVDICCFLKGLEQVERERGWPRRSAKLMLRTGLAMLDRHYHPPAAQPRRSGRILHWGAEGYRPRLAG